jgi:hypothetical protein
LQACTIYIFIIIFANYVPLSLSLPLVCIKNFHIHPDVFYTLQEWLDAHPVESPESAEATAE